MKRIWDRFSNIVVGLITVLAIGMMIFTAISVSTFNRNERNIFGYRLMIVLSDSMSATDFNAGDLIFVKKNVDPETLESGDIISFISQDSANYGQTVTHKIRKETVDKDGNPGFVTYGTTTGIDDAVVVTWPYLLGEYQGRLPGVGTFFAFLKTVPGYLLFIFLPFALLIAYHGYNCVRNFREYREEEIAEIRAERESLKAEREVNQRMLEELEGLRSQLAEQDNGKGARVQREQNG